MRLLYSSKVQQMYRSRTGLKHGAVCLRKLVSAVVATAGAAGSQRALCFSDIQVR